MDSLEKFVREHTNIAVAVYDQRLNPTDSNLAFRNTFKERSLYPSPTLSLTWSAGTISSPR